MSQESVLQLLAAAVVCAGLNYLIASKAGMNRIVWPIIGFLLGLIGLLFALLWGFIKANRADDT